MKPSTQTAAIDLRDNTTARWVDFFELTKPRLNFLVLVTTMVGFYMAARTGGQWTRLPAALIGTALCAAGASILNQWAERRFDALMSRTRSRPIPAHRVTPTTALLLGLACSAAGTACLGALVNGLTAILGLATLACYILIYTPLKRYTTLNTVIGAIPGAIPPVMGWTAVTGHLAPEALALFTILFIWQIPHFLAIAILYRDDYRDAGFRMLPVQDPTLAITSRQILLYTAALIPASIGPVLLQMAGIGYAIAALALGLGFFFLAIRCAASRTRAEARNLFLGSVSYLPLLLAALMLNRV